MSYYPPIPQMAFNAPAMAFSSRQEIIRVNGKGGAEAFQMPPNSEALLLDESDPVVWLVVTDGAGYKTVTSYDITPSVTQEQKDSDRFSLIEERLARLESVFIEPDTRSTKSKSTVKSDSAD